MRLAQARGISVSSPKELYILAKRGNKQAVETFKDAAYYLGIALSNIVNALDPEKIIMAGGIANAWEFMEREAVTTMNRNLLIKNMGVKVEKSDMNDYAGAIGAALLASAPNKALGLKPRIAVDLVILHYTRGRFDGIVLVERKYRPYGWAFPGGMLEYGETLEDAAKREALEETGLHIELLEHFKPYSAPRRDPRHHTVGVVFIARASGKPKPGSDAKDVKIFSLSHIPKLAFDHNRILHDVVKYLRRKYAITL
jgi:ADP-ribose pyrophosphatase YjhB (NUDIX family)